MPASARFLELLKEIEDLHNRKNAGYAGDTGDPFFNFRQAEMFGVSPFTGCLVRMSDKFSRIASLSKNPNNERVGEAITDTLMDLSVYSLIAICLYEEQKSEKQRYEEEMNLWEGASIEDERLVIKALDKTKQDG